ADRRTIEANALDHAVAIERARRDRKVLPTTRKIRKPKIDHLDLVIRYGPADVLWAPEVIGHRTILCCKLAARLCSLWNPSPERIWIARAFRFSGYRSGDFTSSRGSSKKKLGGRAFGRRALRHQRWRAGCGAA